MTYSLFIVLNLSFPLHYCSKQKVYPHWRDQGRVTRRGVAMSKGICQRLFNVIPWSRGLCMLSQSARNELWRKSNDLYSTGKDGRLSLVLVDMSIVCCGRMTYRWIPWFVSLLTRSFHFFTCCHSHRIYPFPGDWPSFQMPGSFHSFRCSYEVQCNGTTIDPVESTPLVRV